MTPAELFRRAGVALFGDEFVAPLARALNVEKGTVRKMAAGQSRVPPGVWLELAGILQDRQAALPALKVAVLEAVEPKLPLRPFWRKALPGVDREPETDAERAHLHEAVLSAAPKQG